MAVFRVERTKDYTIMSNHHLKDTGLSLKAKGLLSIMLSLPDSWNYTTRGLAAICKEGVDAIRSAIRELEAAGYIVRRLLRGDNGRIVDTEYIIYERPQDNDDVLPSAAEPQAGEPDVPSPYPENSYAVEPSADVPPTKKSTQLNINTSKKNQSKTHPANTQSIHPSADGTAEAEVGAAFCGGDILAKREQIRDQIDYDYLVQWEDPKQIDELVELMLEAALTTTPTMRIGREKEYSTALVQDRLRLISADHIVGILESLRENRTQVRNPKAYLLAALFNAPASANNQVTMQVSHDYPRGGRC